ncbi:lamin tail domain-containing protein [Ktedonospora formicarum]|nr:lamin tail domain-containing protein [Ktedonospora formicarum]
MFLLCVSILSLSLAFLVPSSLYAADPPTCVPKNPAPVPTGITAQDLPEQPGVIYINEVMTKPGKILWNCDSQDPKNQDNIWVELYNPSDQAYNLSTNAISLDEGLGTTSFTFPQEAVIAPHGYFTFFPYTTISQAPTETISAFRLINNGTIISTIDFPELATDTSYAYFTEGVATPEWKVATAPTIGKQNTLVTITMTPTKGSTSKESTKEASSKSKSSSSGSSSTTSKESGTTKPVVNGTQPVWDKLNPPGNTTEQEQDQPVELSHITATENSMPRQIVISTLVIFLAIGLYGGMRFLARRRSPTSKKV